MTHSGQRIYLKDGGKWHLLGLASAFEMGLNSATWYYVYQGDLLTITTYTVAAGREIRTRFTSRNQRSYQLLLTNHFIMGAGETQSYQLTQEDKQLKLTAASESLIASEYPDLTFYLQTSQDFTVTDESILGVSADTPELVCLVFDDTPDLEIVIQGNLEGGAFVAQDTDVATEDAAYAAFVDDLLRHFQLSHPHEEVASFNTLTRWYCHNMLVHYLSPHGLEQYGGAAWGTGMCHKDRRNFSSLWIGRKLLPASSNMSLPINLQMMAIGLNGLCLIAMKLKKLMKATGMSSFGR